MQHCSVRLRVCNAGSRSSLPYHHIRRAFCSGRFRHSASAAATEGDGAYPSPSSSSNGGPGPSSSPSLAIQTIPKSSVSPVPTPGHAPRPSSSKQTAFLKSKLLAAVASLDRGLAASSREAQEVDGICYQLEALGGPVDIRLRIPGDIDYTVGTVDEDNGAQKADLFAGMWRLIYTSGFNTGSLGGRRPGPPAALVPSTLGQVYQRIDPLTRKLDNIVELLFSSGLPDLVSGLLGQSQPRAKDTPALRLTLVHEYEIQGANTVQIVYDDTSVELVGSSWFRDLPRLDLPGLPEALRPPRFLRSAKFDVTFLDSGMRITRGDRGELRVYLRDGVEGDRAAAAAWMSSQDE